MGLLILLVHGCAEPLPDTTPYVDAPRVLAVSFEPAEGEPGAAVTQRALYADASGALYAADVAWGFCTARKPLAEAGPVASACLDPASADLMSIGAGLSVEGTLPDDACSLFGPNPPPPDEGGVAGRPVDPDVSGGFYQPVVGFDRSGSSGGSADGDVTLAAARVRCGPANVAQETYVAWNLGYHDNVNPAVTELRVDGTPVASDGADDAIVVDPGQRVALEVTWPACPVEASCGDGVCSGGETEETCEADCAAPVGCGGAELYALHDPATDALRTVRETMSVAWYTTGGSFDAARGGRSAADDASSVDNGWTAPDAPGAAWIGVVLRDDRGGVGYAGYRVSVAP